MRYLAVAAFLEVADELSDDGLACGYGAIGLSRLLFCCA